MVFGKTLKELLQQEGITQQELANKIGVSQRAVSKWINLQSEPTETAIINCAKVFDVSTDFLLGLENESGRKIYNTVSNHIADNHGTINQTNNFN